LAAYSRRARGRFSFTPAALMGLTLRSFPLSKGIHGFRRRMDPHTVQPVGIPDARRHWAGPTSAGFRALTLPRVPGSRTGFNSPTTGCSLGLCPSRVCRKEPRPRFLPNSSHALRNTGLAAGATGAPESRSTLSWPCPRHSASRAHGQDNPFRVLAPARSRTHEQGSIRAMSSPLTAPYITADRPAIFGWSASLDRSYSGYA
jgi:hypothetical protein